MRVKEPHFLPDLIHVKHMQMVRLPDTTRGYEILIKLLFSLEIYLDYYPAPFRRLYLQRAGGTVQGSGRRRGRQFADGSARESQPFTNRSCHSLAKCTSS